MADSGVNEAQTKAIMAWYDRSIQEAGVPPDASKYASVGEYNQAKKHYDANPLAPMVEALGNQIKNEGVSDPHKAKELLELRLAEKRKAFEQGLKTGKLDNGVAQQGAMQELLGGNVTGAIKAFILSIPLVGNLIAAATKWMSSQFSPEKLTFAQAQDRVVLENGLGAAFGSVGIAAPDATVIAIKAYENPPAPAPTKPAPKPAAPVSGTLPSPVTPASPTPPQGQSPC